MLDTADIVREAMFRQLLVRSIRLPNKPALNRNGLVSHCFDSMADWISTSQQVVGNDRSRRNCVDSDEVVLVRESIPVTQGHPCVVELRHLIGIYELFVRTQEHISVGRVMLALARQRVAVEISYDFDALVQAAKTFVRFG